jgi:hypothetical protein
MPDLSFGQLCNKIAKDIPEGFDVEINLKQEYGGIYLITPAAKRIYMGEDCDKIEEQAINALKLAQKIENDCYDNGDLLEDEQ